ncbi:helix-turn-helix transcriptional regulator, partial [Thermogemmatispora sp.]|uniref:helix-turn-helix domain-containing protein n=1 Tax=Thermogemmatispora sp. TaxID=1968838 RepID=UPI002ACC1013
MSVLRRLREEEPESLRRQAKKIGIAVGTLQAAERGEPLRADTIQLICRYYGKTAAELGLVCWRRGKKEAAPKEDEMHRREALTLLAGGSGLALLGGLGSLSLTREEALTIARTVVGALWRTSLSEHVETVAQASGWLLKFLEREPELLQASKEGARIAAEGHLIAAIAARHLLQPGERLRHLQQAERYAHLAGDVLLQRALPYYQGYSYLWGLAAEKAGAGPEPETALLCFQRGLMVRDEPTSRMQDVGLLMGLAEAYSLLGEPKQAGKALTWAEENYAKVLPGEDPGYVLADVDPPYRMPLARARVFLNMGHSKEAFLALEESQRLYQACDKGGRGLADLQPKRAAVALALGDQDLFVEAVRAVCFTHLRAHDTLAKLVCRL